MKIVFACGLFIGVFFCSCKKEEAFEFHRLEYFYIKDGDTLTYIFAPNAFTPDGDGVSDKWTIAVGNYMPGTLQIEVYNDYSETIFQSNTVSPGWDGSYKSIAASKEMYNFKISLRAPDGVDLIFENELFLIR